LFLTLTNLNFYSRLETEGKQQNGDRDKQQSVMSAMHLSATHFFHAVQKNGEKRVLLLNVRNDILLLQHEGVD
jgi:hypothetical protein